jgi:hypothetical protein
MTKKATAVRTALLSALLLATLRGGDAHAQIPDAPSRYVVDSGTVVRLRLVNDDTLLGRLIADFRTEGQADDE